MSSISGTKKAEQAQQGHGELPSYTDLATWPNYMGLHEHDLEQILQARHDGHSELRRLLISLPELTRRSRRGCRFSQMLEASLIATCGSSADIEFIRVMLGGKNAGLYIESYSKSTEEPKFYHRIEICAIEGKPNPWPHLRVCRKLPPEDEDDRTFRIRLAKAWVDDCISQHVECRPRRSRLPRRVIYVGSETVDPCLFTTNGSYGRYLALSHCWGSSMPVKTIKGNIGERSKSVPYSLLPKTFQDAVDITRGVHLEYLWIDSICIIQDSKEDREEQSALMSEIYGGAFFTVYAHGARDCHGGCFLPQTERTKAQIDVPGPDGCNTTALVQERHEFPGSLTTDLDTRGWTLQERIMSPRQLFCSSDEWGWQCLTGRACECRVFRPNWQDVVTRGWISVMGNKTWVENAEINSWDWESIVYSISRRNFTHSDDLLPAVSGLAKINQDSTPDEYICGLWRRTLAHRLGWRHCPIMIPDVIDNKSTRHNDYYAPSWSWASVIGPVQFDDRVEEDTTWYVEISDVKCTPATSNPYGPASDAILTVKGLVIPVCVSKTVTEEDDEKDIDLFAAPLGREDIEERPEEGFLPDITAYDEISEISDQHDHLLLVISSNVDHSKDDFTSIVIRWPRRTSGSFKRIGWLSSEWTEWAPFAIQQTLTLV